MNPSRFSKRATALALAAAFVAGVAHAQAPTDARADPWERMNRGFYAIHQSLDRAVFRPVAMLYKAILPSPVRKGLRNVVANLGKPVVFANDILQHRFTDAGMTLTRFATNSTVGIAGLMDMATRAHVPDHDNGFGNTLGRYGVGPGPYLFIPLVGPSTVRDLIGHQLDVAADPLTWARYGGDAGVSAARTAIKGIDTRAEVDSDLGRLTDQSTDSYATLRSVYLQNRQAEISGADAGTEVLPDFEPEVKTSAGADPVEPVELAQATSPTEVPPTP